MKRTVILSVFVLALSSMLAGGHAQEDIGLIVATGALAVDKEGPMAKVWLRLGGFI